MRRITIIYISLFILFLIKSISILSIKLTSINSASLSQAKGVGGVNETFSSG